jgi:hypothetical protein
VHGPASLSVVSSGAVFGAGTEYHWTNSQWNFGVEYLHYEMNGLSASAMTLNQATGSPISFSTACPAGTAAGAACINYAAGSFGINEVRARASYKF